MWGLTPESVSTMQASGLRNYGDSGYVRSAILGPGAQKNTGAPHRSAPHSLFQKKRLLDLSITGDLCGGGHWRGDFNLWPLHGRKLIGSLACGNPRIVRLHQVLLGILHGVG